MVTHSVYFQRWNNSKISTLIKACQSLSAKDCHAKGRELTLRIYSQLWRVDHRSGKISAVCLILRRQNRSTFWQFTGSATRRHHAQLVSKKILEKKIFVGINFRELVFDRENHENFWLAKISCYTVFKCTTLHTSHKLIVVTICNKSTSDIICLLCSGWRSSLLLSLQSSIHLSFRDSPCTSYTSCKTQHTATTVGTFTKHISFVFIKCLHLTLSLPNAFSATVRAREMQ